MTDVPAFDPHKPNHQNLIRDHTNDLLTELRSSPKMVPFVMRMKVYHVPVRSRAMLITGDLPLMQSDGIARTYGFLMLPYAPDKLLTLAHNANVALAFSTQDPDVLVRGLNDAFVRQARQVLIATDSSARQLIEDQFE